MNKPQNLQKRFYKYVNPIKTEKGCLEWIGAKNKLGYGKFSYLKKNRLASRVSWILHKAEIPDNLWVLHQCDNQACINPDHLFLGTRQDNMNDMMKKGRQWRPINNKFNAKLKLEEVNFIRNSNLPNRQLAKRFAVSDSLIFQIKKEQIWKHAN